jgi:SAM-dependent methyltransferase
MIKVITKYPIAFDSPDHLYPWGTKRDNSTNIKFIDEIENYFGNKKISYMDIGCSGGQLVKDFGERGHISIGLEGSDYSLINDRANWAELANKLLFTCDVSYPFTILNDDEPLKFDCITAWELIEHLHPERLDAFFQNVLNHLSDDGLFCASIATVPDKPEGHDLHLSVFSPQTWIEEILPKYFDLPYKTSLVTIDNWIMPTVWNHALEECPIVNWVRYGISLEVAMIK